MKKLLNICLLSFMALFIVGCNDTQTKLKLPGLKSDTPNWVINPNQNQGVGFAKYSPSRIMDQRIIAITMARADLISKMETKITQEVSIKNGKSIITTTSIATGSVSVDLINTYVDPSNGLYVLVE